MKLFLDSKARESNRTLCVDDESRMMNRHIYGRVWRRHGATHFCPRRRVGKTDGNRLPDGGDSDTLPAVYKFGIRGAKCM